MKKFFSLLLSSSNKVSSRRFIAILTLPFYLMSICIGAFHDDFRFFISSLVASSLPIMMAFYKLQWDNVTAIVSNILRKRDEFSDQFTNDQFTDDQLKDP